MRISDAANYFISDLNGSGVKVAVADSGMDQDHGDMNGRISYVESLTWGDSSTEDRHSGHGNTCGMQFWEMVQEVDMREQLLKRSLLSSDGRRFHWAILWC